MIQEEKETEKGRKGAAVKVLSFGSLNLDFRYEVEHILRPGETLASKSLELHFGGKGFNQSVALSRGGAKVWHVGKVGKDGKDMASFLEENGVCTDMIEVDEEAMTGQALIQVDASSGENCILLTAGTNGMIDKNFIHQAAARFEKGDCAVFQNEISNVEYAMEYCKKQGLQIAFNPSPMSEELAKSDVFQYVDYLFVNETEGTQLSGKKEPEDICRTLAKRWPGCCIILTLGTRGAMVLKEGRLITQKSYPCKAVDTTGAGDTFSGYFLASVLRGESCERALELASKASSLAVRKAGAAEAVPMLQEVLDFQE